MFVLKITEYLDESRDKPWVRIDVKDEAGELGRPVNLQADDRLQLTLDGGRMGFLLLVWDTLEKEDPLAVPFEQLSAYSAEARGRPQVHPDRASADGEGRGSASAEEVGAKEKGGGSMIGGGGDDSATWSGPK